MQVLCGLDHTLVVAQTGEVFAFGDNSLSQLGRDGSMGIEGASGEPQDWVVKDEDGEITLFAKASHAFDTST